MKRQLIYALTLTATLAASVLPASANPVAPSSRGSNDSRGMCNDVYVGQNTQNNIQQRNDIVQYSQNNNGTSANAWNYMNSSSGYNRQSASGGGGFSFLGIGASGGGGSSSASGFSNYNSNRGSNSSSFNRDYRYGHDKSTFSDTSSSTAVVGQDCTAVVQSRTAITQQLIGW
jgi:hypothetical protein